MKQTAVALNSELIKIMDGMKPKLSRISGKPVNNRSDILRVFINYFQNLDDAGKMVDQAKWIFDPESEPTNAQIYDLLKNNDDPKLARYLFLTFGNKSEYRRNKAFIFLQMADPESPFYIPYVKDALSDLFTLKEEKENVVELQKKRQKLQDEIEELQTEVQTLTSKVDELTAQKTQFEQVIAEYNKQMTRIASFEPIDAVDIIFNVLDEAQRREKPGRDWDAELSKRLVEARDYALKLRDHYHTFDMVRMGDMQEKMKLEDVKEIDYLIDRNFPKWWKKLQAELDTIREAHDYEAEQITHGNFWISADHYYTLDKIRNKIQRTFIDKN